MIIHLDSSNISLTKTAGFEFFEESQLPGKFDYEYWKSMWDKMFELKMGTIIADVLDGELRGMMGALIFQDWLTNDKEALEAFWYVRREHRGTPIGIRILKEYERWAKEQGAVRAKMVHLEVINADMLEKIYLRMGYSKLQRSYSKELYERVQN